MRDSIISAPYPLQKTAPGRTDAPQTRYMEGPRPPCGFWYPTVDQILVSWLAYMLGEIQYQALRGYWYLHEMKMQRCEIAPGTRVHYPLFNLEKGIETGPRQAQQIRDALGEVGLAIWTDDDIQLPTQLKTLPWLDRHMYNAMRAKVDTKLAKVPLHRSVGRYLAREGSPGLLATTLGVALRCLRYHGRTKKVSYAGAVSSGWQASLWAFSERTAYRGLDRLESLSFLRTERRTDWPEWHEEEFGPWRIVARDWAAPKERPRRPQQLSLPLPIATSVLARAGASSPSVLANTISVDREGDDATDEASVALIPDPSDPVEDRCKKLSPRSCMDLAVLRDSNHNKDMDLRTTSSLQPLRGKDKHHSEPAPEPAPLALPPNSAALASSSTASGVCHDGQKKPETSQRPPDMDALAATYTALAPEEQAALRTQAEAMLIQKGAKRDFLIWPAILSTIGSLLEPQDMRAALEPLSRATDPFPPRTSTAGGCAEALPSPAPAGPVASRSDRKRKRKPPAPTLRHILLEDLQDTGRLLVLLDQAREQGLIGKAPADRLTFCAMAAHALRIGDDNPCGLFYRLLHDDQLRLYVSDADDEAARGRLNANEYGIDPQRQAQPPPVSDPPALSKDAWCVRELQRDLARQGVQVDVLEQLHREDPTCWPDGHCATIARELAHYQHACQQAKTLSHLGDLGLEEDWWAALSPEDLTCAECGEEGPACACQAVEDVADG